MLSIEKQSRTCKNCNLKLNGCSTWEDRKEQSEKTISGWDINKMAESCKEYAEAEHG